MSDRAYAKYVAFIAVFISKEMYGIGVCILILDDATDACKK